MKSLILLIHTQAHVDALPETAQTIVRSGYDRCWIILSPAIAVDAKTATEKLDGEIAALLAAQNNAAAREDFEAAAGHKLAREGKVLDRDKAIADAWKSVPEEDRKLAYQTKLTPLFSALREGKVAGRMNATQEHYAVGQWIQMLNSLSGVWPKEMPHGEYVVAWPGAIPQGQKTDVGVVAPRVEPTREEKEEFAKAVTKSQPAFASREEELLKMPHFTLMGICKPLGVDTKDKKRPQIVAEVLAKEAEAQLASM